MRLSQAMRAVHGSALATLSDSPESKRCAKRARRKAVRRVGKALIEEAMAA